MVLAALAGACSSLVAPLVKPDVGTQSAALRAGQYALDPAHAALIFKIDHLGFSDYVGRFESFDATLDFDADDPTAARIEAVVDISSLDVGDDDFAATLIGGNWLDAERFPQARFTSTDITVTGENSGVMIGELTLHGETAPVTLDVTFNGGANDRLRGGDYIVGFSASGKFDRTVFGVDRFSGIITETVVIEIEAEFIRNDD